MLVDSLWYLQLLITLCNVRVAEVASSTLLDLSMSGQRQGQGLQQQILHSRVFPNVSLGLEPEEEDHHRCKWDKRGLRFKG
jgi:hypothetical protein